MSPHNSPLTLFFFLTVLPSVPLRLPATVANLITLRFTGGHGEVNRGDKEGKDRSSEEGRWRVAGGGGGGGVGESDGQMWRDKQERVGLRWKLSTNLKECIGKKRAAGVVRVMVGNLERVGHRNV